MGNTHFPKIDIAPMLDYTHQHARYFYRLFSPNFVLYTEMIVAQALIHGNPKKFLQHHQSEAPLILQLGGSDPHVLTQAVNIAAEYDFSGVNLNVGCPSSRVKSGKFGACLMYEPQLVAECINAMSQTHLPISIKCRLGVDHQDTEESLNYFIKMIYENTPCREFIIHARKAWLEGLNPKQNRDIPPLNYARVYQLQKDFPDAKIIINGGIQSIEAIQTHLANVSGVMIGREITKRPRFLLEMVEFIFREQPENLKVILLQYFDYIENAFKENEPLRLLLQPLFGIFYQMPLAKKWRIQLDGFLKKNYFDKTMLLSFF